MTERQIKALNSLFIATTEVMEAFEHEEASLRNRRESLTRMIENFLISASQPNAGFTYGEVPNFTGEITRDVEENLPISTPKSEKGISGVDSRGPESAVSNTPSNPQDFETRYAIQPILVDNSYCFKRIKTEEDKDSNSIYLYKIQLNGDKGFFSIDQLPQGVGDEDIRKLFPELVVEIMAGSTPISGASNIKTVEKGEVQKDGKSWKITKRVKIHCE